MGEKIKSCLAILDRKDVSAFTAIFLVGIGGFALGRLSINKAEAPSVTLENIGSAYAANAAASGVTVQTAPFVGSYSSKKFHRFDCPGAKLIKEENKVEFETKEEALASGYTPASNCRGL